MSPTAAGGAPAELDGWRGEGVRLTDVLDALAGLRAGQGTATRTSVVNLVIVAADEAEGQRALEALHHLGGRHPGRCMLLVADETGATHGIDAQVMLRGGAADGRAVWSEEIRLRVGGPVNRHRDSLIEPLTLPDLPVAVWFVRTLPEPSDPLLGVADGVIVDTKEVGGGEAFPALADLVRRHVTVDLSWVRLGAWRGLLANLFEPAPFRPFLPGVVEAEVRGKPGPRRLLGGWLSSSLGLRGDALRLVDGRHVAVRLAATHQSTGGTFAVGRAEGERLVRASARVEGGPCHEDRLSLPDESLPWSLAEALTHLERDPVHERALQAALHLSGAG